MHGAQRAGAPEEFDRVVGAGVADAREHLRVDDEAFEVRKSGGESAQEAGGVAEREEFEGEGFDGGRERGDAEGRRRCGGGEKVRVGFERDLRGTFSASSPGRRRSQHTAVSHAGTTWIEHPEICMLCSQTAGPPFRTPPLPPMNGGGIWRASGPMETDGRMESHGNDDFSSETVHKNKQRKPHQPSSTLHFAPRKHVVPQRHRHRALSRRPSLRPTLLPDQAHAHGSRDVDAAGSDVVESRTARGGGRAVSGLVHDGVPRRGGAAGRAHERGERGGHAGYREFHGGDAGVGGRRGGGGELRGWVRGGLWGGERGNEREERDESTVGWRSAAHRVSRLVR
nr:hypothetical protein CFP56_24292 [Quercus suber]